MRLAIDNRDNWALSCVVVWPGHPMDLPGSVGVIFKPTCASVISVSNSDSGSCVLADGTDGSLGLPLSAESLEVTFQVAGAYNEWRVKGAEVEGIFVSNPSNITVKKEVELQVGAERFKEIAASGIALSEVFDAFPGLSIFTLGPSGKTEILRK